jgi:CRP-like cAMP-binding protein
MTGKISAGDTRGKQPSKDDADERRRTPLHSDEVEPHTCTPQRRLELLAQVPFFVSLAPADIADINRSFQTRSFEAGDLIYAAGDEARRLYVVLSGKVKLVRHTLAGQDVLLDLLAPGEFFGTLSALGEVEYPDTARAQTACCAISIESEAFQAVMQRYPPVTLAVLDIVRGRLRSAHDVIGRLSAQPVEGRIAATILALANRMGEPQPGRILIQAPISRQDLADMAGTTLESASRVVSQLRKEGLIESGRQWIAILDRERLESLAEG